MPPFHAAEGRALREKERCRKPQGVSWGFFVGEVKFPGSREICERIRPPAPPKRRLRRNRGPAVLRGADVCAERSSGLFRIPGLPGSYGRSRPHGSCSPAGPPHRVARAEFDGRSEEHTSELQSRRDL